MQFNILSIFLDEPENGSGIYCKKISWSPNQIWVLNDNDKPVMGLKPCIGNWISKNIFTIHDAKNIHIIIDENKKELSLKEIWNTKDIDIFSIIENVNNEIYKIIEEYFKEEVKDS